MCSRNHAPINSSPSPQSVAGGDPTMRYLFSSPIFRLLYAGCLASAITDGLIPIAFAVEVLRLSDSPWALSYVLIGLWVGQVAITPLSGRMAARHNPLQVMIYADAIRIAAQAGLVTALLLANNSIPAMTISAVIYGLGSGFYRPAQQTALPILIESSLLVKANASFSAAADLGLIFGPALGLIAVQSIGFMGVLIADCVSFGLNIAALLWLLAIRHSGQDQHSPTTEGNENLSPEANEVATDTAGTVRTAWIVATRDRFLGASLLFWTIASALIGMIAVDAPTRIIDELGRPTSWAIISTVMAVSSLVGSLAAGFGSRLRYPIGVAATATLLMLQLTLILQGFHGGIGQELFTYFVFGAGALMTTWTGIQWTTAVQQRLERVELARFSAVKATLTGVGVPLGMAAGPLLMVGTDVVVLISLALVTATATALVVHQSKRSDEYAIAQ